MCKRAGNGNLGVLIPHIRMALHLRRVKTTQSRTHARTAALPCSLVMTVNSISFLPSFRFNLCSSAEVSLMDFFCLAVGGSANVVGAVLRLQ